MYLNITVYIGSTFADLIARLTKGQRQYRPKLPKVEDDTPPEAVKLVEECWVDDPSTRPTFEMIIKMIQSINKDE